VEKELKALRAEYDAMPSIVKLQGGAFFRQLFTTLASMQAGIVHVANMVDRGERD